MKYGSVCSGIEAATVAWHPLGWEPSFFSEIEKFPRAVLQHHYPDVPLHGDFTTIENTNYDPIELLVGGTPCQSFSVAGLRGGMDDDRGNLALEYLRLAQRLGPKWLVWENVPGVLSSNGGADFGAFLGGLGELGYGFAYRVLDAQYFGVPQRRRRVFVIGYLGDWRPAAAVLFERESLRRNSAPSRKEKKDVASTITAGLGRRRGSGIEPSTIVSSEISPVLRAQSQDSHREDSMAYVAEIPTTHRMRGFGDYALDTVASALKSRDYKDATDLVCVHGTQDPCVNANLAHTLGINNGQENAILFDPTQITSPNNRSNPKHGDPSHTLNAAAHAPVIAIQNATRGKDQNGLGISDPDAPMYTLDQGSQHAVHQSTVRRLTPVECERLQGFPDSYTAIPWGKKSAGQCPDGPRYKAIGNSMAVPVMHWLGQCIEMVDNLLKELANLSPP